MSSYKFKIIGVFTLIMAMTVILGACDMDDEGEMYVLTLGMEGNGSLPEHNLGETLYEEGTMVSFEPEPGENYVFAGWGKRIWR